MYTENQIPNQSLLMRLTHTNTELVIESSLLILGYNYNTIHEIITSILQKLVLTVSMMAPIQLSPASAQLC